MRWKWVLGIAAVLIFILVVTVYLILASYDYNKLKPWITEVVQELLGHTRSDMTQRYAKYAKTNRLREMLEEAGL